MSDPNPLDPMALWRDVVSRWEAGVNQVAGDTLGSPGFAQGMHGAMGTSLSAQKAFADGMGRYLSALNLPTRADVAALGERLSDIEARLIRTTTLLEQLTGATGASPGAAVAKVPRTRRPPVTTAAPVVARSEARPARKKAARA